MNSRDPRLGANPARARAEDLMRRAIARRLPRARARVMRNALRYGGQMNERIQRRSAAREAQRQWVLDQDWEEMDDITFRNFLARVNAMVAIDENREDTLFMLAYDAIIRENMHRGDAGYMGERRREAAAEAEREDAILLRRLQEYWMGPRVYRGTLMNANYWPMSGEVMEWANLLVSYLARHPEHKDLFRLRRNDI